MSKAYFGLFSVIKFTLYPFYSPVLSNFTAYEIRRNKNVIRSPEFKCC